MEIHTDRIRWAKEIQYNGATELLRETGDESYPTDVHLYAVGNGGSRLFGTWNMKKDEGVIYHGKGMMFDKRKRKFKKEKF